MTSRSLCALALCLTVSGSWACGSDDPPTGVDGGTADGAVAADGGVRALCPMLEAPQCTAAATCGAAATAPNDCAGCRPHYEIPCSFGACTELSDPVALLNVVTDITNVIGAVRSFVITGVAAETAGGLALSCADLLGGGTVSLDQPCMTILDSRTYDLGELHPSGNIYPVVLSRFPTSARALILIQAFADARGNGALVGHTCVEMQAGQAITNNRIDLDGMTIQRL